jgi:predicted nucleic acid-binding protein
VRNGVLIDSGPLIALFDRSDRFHEPILEFLKSFEGKLVSTWPVLTEVSHLLDFNLKAQIDFLRWIERGAVEVAELVREDLEGIVEMMERYMNVPMDLADATLLYVAQKEAIGRIITIDRDFDIYRMGKNEVMENIFKR